MSSHMISSLIFVIVIRLFTFAPSVYYSCTKRLLTSTNVQLGVDFRLVHCSASIAAFWQWVFVNSFGSKFLHLSCGCAVNSEEP